MPLAGHDHVVVTVHPTLHRPPGLGGRQRRRRRAEHGLGLLAAEAAAHTPHLDRHLGVADAEQMGDQVLHFAGMLGRTGHVQPARLERDGERDLAFEVEVVLAADLDPALQAVRRGGQSLGHVAPAHHLVLLDQEVQRPGLVDRDRRRQGIVDHLGQGGGAAGRLEAGRGHGEQAVADVFDEVPGEQPVVMPHGSDIVLARDVLGGEHRRHAGRGPYP